MYNIINIFKISFSVKVWDLENMHSTNTYKGMSHSLIFQFISMTPSLLNCIIDVRKKKKNCDFFF